MMNAPTPLSITWPLVVLLLAALPVQANDKAQQPITDYEPYTLWTGEQDPADVANLPPVPGMIYRQPQVAEEGWEFLHGAAVIHYKGQLFANWAHNPGKENTSTELVRGRRSSDDGKTWSEAELVAPGFDETTPRRHSHGVLLNHGGKLWCFVSNFGVGKGGAFPGLATEAFTLNEETDKWESQGLVAKDCWPMDAPMKMPNGNWIMGGLSGRITSCVAISHGDDLTKWDTVHIEWPRGRGFQETSVITQGDEVIAFIRSEEKAVAIAVSQDYGRTWSEVMKANYPMAASQPFADVLSTGQRYLISNINNRNTLAIAVSKPGESTLSKVWSIRNGAGPDDYQGKIRGGNYAYPYAYEHEGKLYVVYSVRKRECEMAILPVDSLAVE